MLVRLMLLFGFRDVIVSNVGVDDCKCKCS